MANQTNRTSVEKKFYEIDDYATQSWVEEKIQEAIDNLPEPEPEPPVGG